MAVTQQAPVGSTFGDTISDPAWKNKPTWYPSAIVDLIGEAVAAHA